MKLQQWARNIVLSQIATTNFEEETLRSPLLI